MDSHAEAPQARKKRPRQRPRPSPCHTCRRQRLRCDSTRPKCQKCADRGVECLGYAAQPLLWVQPKSDTSSESASPEESGKKRGRPKLVLMPGQAPPDAVATRSRTPTKPSVWVLLSGADMHGKKSAVRRKQPSLSTGLAPAGYHDSRLALDSLAYVNNCIVPDMVLVDSPSNPHRSDLQYWRYIPDVVVDMLISAALTHQVIRCQATQDGFKLPIVQNSKVALSPHRMASFHNPAITQIYTHQRRTLQAVSEVLDDPELRYSDIVLAVVVMLIRVEVQQSAFGAWPAHLDAARTVVAKRGGFKRAVDEDVGYLTSTLTNYMVIDIMSSVFTPVQLLNARDTILQLDYIPMLDTFYNNGRDYDFPCPNQLLETIIRTNHMRIVPPTDTTCAQILYRISSFDAQFWSQCQLRELSSSPDADLLAMTHDLGLAIQYATMMYCIRTLYLDRGKSVSDAFSPPLATALVSQDVIDAPHTTALRGLLGALRRLWAQDKKSPTWMGKLTFWPLWVAGMEAGPDDRAFLLAALHELCFILGDLGPLDAISALQVVWKAEGGSWDEKLAMPGMRGMFVF